MLSPLLLSSLIKNLIYLGKSVYDKGYIVANGGNLSARIDNSHILIKKSGSSLGNLIPTDFMIAQLSEEYVPKASIDYSIHRAIYLNTDSKYVLHIHPISIISLSLNLSECFVPYDFESRYYFGDCVPVVEGEHSTIYKKIGVVAESSNVIIEKTHGVYIHGEDVKELLYQTERLEHAATIECLYLSIL